MNEELKTYLDKKFDSVTNDISELSNNITEVSVSLGQLANHMEERFTAVDARFDELVPTVSLVENHDKRIKFLEDRLPKLA